MDEKKEKKEEKEGKEEKPDEVRLEKVFTADCREKKRWSLATGLDKKYTAKKGRTHRKRYRVKTWE